MTYHFGGLKLAHWTLLSAIGLASCAAPAIGREKNSQADERGAKSGAAVKDDTQKDQADTTQITAEIAVSDDDDRAPPLNVQNINGRDRVSILGTSFAAAEAPFTSSWYDNHPHSWKTADLASDAWATASLTSALNWLDIADAPADDKAAGDKQKDTDDKDDKDTAADSQDKMDDDDEDEASTSDVEAAKELARSGAAQVSAEAKFLPLGVYALAPQDQDDATAMLQVSITKEGVVRGTYYDLLSEAAHPIQGALDKESERVAFTIGEDGTTIFETKLADLTNPEGEVSLHFADGEASDWTLGRFETLGSAGTEQK